MVTETIFGIASVALSTYPLLETRSCSIGNGTDDCPSIYRPIHHHQLDRNQRSQIRQAQRPFEQCIKIDTQRMDDLGRWRVLEGIAEAVEYEEEGRFCC